jgi:phenylalanyl-tRNA synthetase beta chain
MRTSLIPGLIGVLKTNTNQGESNLKIFEWGKIFIYNNEDSLPSEKPYIAALMSGLAWEKEWYNEERNLDFFDIKGAVEILLNSLNLRGANFTRDNLPPYYNQDVSCGILISDTLFGYVGQISQNTLDKYDIDANNSFVFELDIEMLINKVREMNIRFEPFTKFPAVYRDISIIVDKKVESAQIFNIIERKGAKLVESVKLFDLYRSKKMGPDIKALSFRICYRSKEETLDGKEINLLHESIINAIMEETGGRLREG